MLRMKRFSSLLIIIFIAFQAIAQDNNISGFVYGQSEKQGKIPLPYANVLVSGTQNGALTDETGFFKLQHQNQEINQLVVSHVGYSSDTIQISNREKTLEIVLMPTIELDEIQVTDKRATHSISTIEPINVEVITSDGLQQLACCSLAESFESTVTIDVGYTDAVSGAKQIKMLGLAGVYSQILIENQPSIRILSSTFGLNYIPGPWMSGISISKGTSSVIYGYESITGQINIDLKKPESGEILYAELFINEHQRLEINASSAFKVNDKLSSIVLVHGSGLKNKVDNNNDGFLDLPTGNLFIISNRYFYNSKGKFRTRFGFEFMQEDRVSGQVGYSPEIDPGTFDYYGIQVKSNRFNIYENAGYLLDPDNNGSVAVNAVFVYHKTNSIFGLRDYDAEQKSLNVRLRYKTNLGSEHHKFDGGISFMNDNLSQKLKDTTLNRNEIVPGIFGEYIYSGSKLTVIAGLRYDINNLYGAFFTPRVHAKFGINDFSTLRASIGKGYRTANVIPENIGLLASSRSFFFLEDFKMEEAWNYGINFTRKWFFDDTRKLTFNIDFYRTEFQNQIVVDVNQSASSVYFYNLKGKSYSNSFQTDLIFVPIEGWEVTMAYRFNDVKITMGNELINKPLVSPHKGLVSLHYSTKYEKWNFTLTTQYNGQAKLPYTLDNPVEYQLDDRSPAYLILHTQILRKFSKWEIYFGAENLANYKQPHPILAADDPFGDYFDSSIVWGPIIGRSINAGVRLKINK